ncbi:jouberin [Holotrichia oblita]|uniref:Jouberin n=1 Tax=Holotrichia oblita TaxID=644536 RepID=A0ACB9TX36_HOLOL|nr:jouberin [Holotrichia oblita]
MAKSVTSETKSKFESLLKHALNKKTSKSSQNLIESEAKTLSDAGVVNEGINPVEDIVSKNYILDKFFNNDEVKENDEAFTKPPIPKPRKKIHQSPNDSNETYSVKSAKVLNIINDNCNNSESNETYDLPRRISRQDSDTSGSSTKTYNVTNTQRGDVLYHDKVSKTSIVEVNAISPFGRPSTSYKISGHEIEMANFHDEPETIQSIEDILQETEIKTSDSERSTRITFENELKGKRKKKVQNAIETVEEPLYKYDQIMSIVVHNTDRLELNSFVIHPVVKVYLVDYETGEYIKKTDASRGAVYYHENLTYILPVITQNFNLQEKRGWHRIAWAFLKINAANGTTNTGTKLRLQLYKPGQDVRRSCPVFDWWRGKRIKYSSTLYVTVKGITSPNTIIETFRSKTPLEKEKSASIPDDGTPDIKSSDDLVKSDKEKVKAVLSVLDNKVCKLPNSILTDIESGDEGCFVLKFSNSGMFLACATKIRKNYTLILYAILPHPSFVYWCEISSDKTIATACYDKTVRIWNTSDNPSKVEYFLVDELEGHTGYVTCLCFNSNGNILFTSDSIGEIFLWKRADRVWKHLKTIKLLELRNVLINQIFLHKNERKLIVHARDSIIRVVDVKNECIVQWLEGALNTRVRTSCCITHCGTYIISGSDNGAVHVWEADTGKCFKTYYPYNNTSAKNIPVHAVDISSTGNLMAAGHFGRSVPIQVYHYDPKICSDQLPSSKDNTFRAMVHKTEADVDKAGDTEKEDSEKDVDLNNILAKIDRIIK